MNCHEKWKTMSWLNNVQYMVWPYAIFSPSQLDQIVFSRILFRFSLCLTFLCSAFHCLSNPNGKTIWRMGKELKDLPFAKHPVNLTVCPAVDLMMAVLMTMQNHCRIPTNPFPKIRIREREEAMSFLFWNTIKIHTFIWWLNMCATAVWHWCNRTLDSGNKEAYLWFAILELILYIHDSFTDFMRL